MRIRYCFKCSEKKVPRGIKFCPACVREINDMHENPMAHMRALRAVADDPKTKMAGFLSIMHPEMSDRRKRELVNSVGN